MGRTDWNQIGSGKDLSSVKTSRKRVYVSQKILSDNMPQYVEVSKEKPANEQFEDKVWLLFLNMGFTDLNTVRGFCVSYDFHDDSLMEPLDVVAIDEETIIIVKCNASPTIVEQSFSDNINSFGEKTSGIRKEFSKQ